MQKPIDFLRDMLEYELEAAERYRRFLSLVMVADPERTGPVESIIGESLRQSDIMALLDGAAVILMSETNGDGARVAIERFKDGGYSNNDLRFSLATFPEDGRGVESLIAIASRRLQKAFAGLPLSVVASG